MPDFRTLRIDALKKSNVSTDGSKITIVCENPKGATNLIEMTPETAAALVGGLRDACKIAAQNRAKAGIKTPLEQVWIAERVFATYPVRGKVLIHVQSGGMTQVFELPASEVATLVHELSDGLKTQGLDDQTSHDTDMGLTGAVIPSVLTLTLATLPIRTSSMTDYPDGLSIEMGLAYPPPLDSKKVRIPMFADTARALIGALQERLAKMESESPTPQNRKPS
jgi:hypothetical protein